MLKLEQKSYRTDRSIFHTNEPRETMMTVHLLLVFLCLATALGFAIIYAETSATKFPMASQKTLLGQDDTNITYGRSE